ncbi:unnamed protein product, partial [Brenthis ino]
MTDSKAPTPSDDHIPQVSHIALKLPPFWSGRVVAWFAQAEANFEISDIMRPPGVPHEVKHDTEHRILTTDGPPVAARPRRLAPQKLQAAQREFADMVSSDASSTHVGAALQQRVNNQWEPLAFFSKKLTPRQTTWPAYYRELLGVYEAVQHFRLTRAPDSVSTKPTAAPAATPQPAPSPLPAAPIRTRSGRRVRFKQVLDL